jgi:hypothetical protein
MVEESEPIEALHDEIDVLAGKLATHHAARLQCKRGCAACCVDDITVFEVEAERIRTRHAAMLERAQPHPVGACAFLDEEGACRIYAERPYVCRTQGLPLRWIVEVEDGVVEHRDICELNDPGPPITELEAEVCWTLGPAESKLYGLQRKRGSDRRVGLRALFRHRDDG